MLLFWTFAAVIQFFIMFRFSLVYAYGSGEVGTKKNKIGNKFGELKLTIENLAKPT